ncbi:Uncharacterised protein [Zhongshania aliphaticivorans]|uniref:DUF3604 domain-containing protein n=1 Tax=Zhongshania aliphaticivorans TaxID=1470434 RepID=A0A5S9NG63_9GAMM|nr:Uncharacterised protein [Zhongshania aliphaticivorans]CAA0115226.1 Uncharacterised protein [Zhongshania aliphaticivorans]CAA0120068.1 Uncharacterised protein [Zhongshania aliphaticivorans]
MVAGKFLRHFSSVFRFILLLVNLSFIANASGETTTSGRMDSQADNYRELRQPCVNHKPLRQVFFGDTHVHTKYSLDASTQGTRTSPADAYRFARGAEIGVQPWTADGKPLRRLQLDRPLDFAVVTDHAELFGEVEVCQTPALSGYDSWQCKMFRQIPRAAFFLFNTQSSRAKRLGVCGENGENCRNAALRPWQEMQQAAEDAYDRTESCEFTSFVAYEWTGASANLANLHRNIIFKNEHVPTLPLSFIDTPSAPLLWDGLDRDCVNAGTGCDVLVIPHNSNLSDGYMFSVARDDGKPITTADAEQRARLERLVEVMQHKGSSECFYDPLNSADELCGFEQLPYNSFPDKFIGKVLPFFSQPPSAKSGFIRDVLREGLAQEQRLGVNPFKLGFIASSDTHIGAPGAVMEQNFLGHGGAGEPAGDKLPQGLPDDLEFNPGGLAAVWAEENTRSSLFEAMRRRETYGTSGPRIRLRFFGGDESLPEDICERNDYAAIGYKYGVPMGGDLMPKELASAPVFTVFAQMDAGRSGTANMPLQKIQIIKGSIDREGNKSEKVIDVIGDENGEVGVNLQNCEPFGRGHSQLCGRWQDSQFNANEHAYYYARVLENPSCRWSQRICVAAKVDCNNAESIKPGYEGCCAQEHRPIIQERAWSSPIWYSPIELDPDLRNRPLP